MNSSDYLPYLYNLVIFAVGGTIALYLIFNRKWIKQGWPIELCLCVFSIYIMTFIPDDASIATDRINYAHLFETGEATNITDIGFLGYVWLCRVLLRGNVDLFFGLSAIIYVGALWLLSKILCGRKSVYVIITAFMSLGFLSYNVNTLRAGLALALFLFAIASHVEKNKVMFVSFSVLSVLLHFSTALIVISYLLSLTRIKIKWYYFVWIVFLIISFLNIASPLTDFVRLADNIKINGYLDARFVEYKVGFRWDFIMYSLFPLFIGYWFAIRNNYHNPIYLRLYKCYILTNAIWLLYIRIPFTNRVAFLSWFLLPFLVLLPFFDGRYKNGQAAFYSGMIIAFVCILNLVI